MPTPEALVGWIATVGSTGLILAGIVLTAAAPTIAIVVTHFLQRAERARVAAEVQAVADDLTAADTVSQKHYKDTAARHKDTTEQLNEIHILVNGRLSEALERIARLQDALGIGDDDPAPEPT